MTHRTYVIVHIRYGFASFSWLIRSYGSVNMATFSVEAHSAGRNTEPMSEACCRPEQNMVSKSQRCEHLRLLDHAASRSSKTT